MHTKKVLAAFLAVVLMVLSIPLMGGVAASGEEGMPIVTTLEDTPVCEGPTVSLEKYELTEDRVVVDLYVNDWDDTCISKYILR